MRILITGVAGLIGSRLASHILSTTEHSVVGVDDLSSGLVNNIPEGLEAMYAVRVGERRLDEVFAVRCPDVVYHFAAHAAECMSPFARCQNYQENLVATADVVNCCIAYDVQRLVFASSMAVYGRGSVPFDESQACHPIDPYGVAKMASELDIQIAGEQHGIDWCIVRPHNVYGPGQSFLQPYRNVLSIWLHRHSCGLPLLVYGDGLQRRAFSYIDDCLEPLYRASHLAEASRQIINLGGTCPVTINEAADLCASILPGAVIEHCEPRHEVRDAWATWEKSENILGYTDTWSLDRGVAELRQWMDATTPRSTPIPMRVEVEAGLYAYWKSPQGGSSSRILH